MVFSIYLSVIISILSGIYCKNETFDMRVGERKKVIIFENSSNIISVSAIPSSATALLFEVHSQIEEVTLSEEENICVHCSVTGKNVGMVYKLQPWESAAHMWLLNQMPKNITVLIITSTLDAEGPVPGGCNMEFPTEIAPYLKLRNEYGKAYLEFQHASIGSTRDEPSPLCSLSLPYFTYEIYVSYLKENDFTEKEYFDKITGMSNLSSLPKSASKVTQYSLHPDTRFSFLMYPNVGVVYNVIAKYTVNGAIKESRYVPISSYGCGNSELTDFGCNFSYIVEGKAFLFFLSMYGFIITFFGNTFFSSSMFFFGFVATFFVILVLIGRFSNISKAGIVKISAIVGILGGGIWLGLWLWLNNPIISVLLVGFVLGFLISATVLYSPIGNYEINLNSKNYWLLLATGSLLVTVILLSYPDALSILGSSVVGSYCMLLFYDDFIGTRLAFIILNIIKRAISRNLEFAANDYPFEVKDAMIYAAWVILTVFAVVVQSRAKFSSTRDQISLHRQCCCKSRRPEVPSQRSRLPHNQERSQAIYDMENPRQPLCNSDSVFYNTFPR